MQKGDIVLLELTGRDAETGKIFETTNSEIAKKEGFFSERSRYQPTPIVVGKSRLIQGIEEVLKEMKIGEEKKIVLGPEKAFGERKPELIGIVPLKEFTSRKVNPFPGLVVDVNGNAGKVQSVSGGRVRVDFNNDLAGRTVEYELKIVKKLENVEEKAKALIDKLLGNAESKASFKQESAELLVELPLEFENMKEAKLLKEFFSKELQESIPELKKVCFKEPPVSAKEGEKKPHVHGENCNHQH